MSAQDSNLSTDLNGLREQVSQFAEERDWRQFHSPKNLAMALSVEAGELLERFQWSTQDQSDNLSARDLAAVREEVADVFIYLILIADRLDIGLVEAAQEKLAINREKYPIDKAKGNSTKYSEYDKD